MESSYQIETSAEQAAKIAEFNPTITVCSPGRVNLIGEHVDYNDGLVMPTAIDKNILFYFRPNGTKNICSVSSLNYQTHFNFDLNEPKLDGESWTKYVVGVVEEIKKLGKQPQGFDCLLMSDLPMGAGISSSAALECGLAYGLNELFDLGLSRIDIVKLSQKAEHNYVGTNCGIMDQFASVMSKDGHVLKLDCQNLAYELLPFEIAPYKLLLLNTNVSHSLSESEYNVRRKECEDGVAIIKEKYPEIDSLRDVTLDQLNTCKGQMPESTYTRCSYVIEEILRVKAAAKALKEGDLKGFGKFMYASHEGLQHKYGVSCDELDFLTDFSKNYDDILGCRMMGGGFGGCTINLIHEDKIGEYVAAASEAYRKKFDIKLTAFTTVPANGTTLVQPNKD